MTRNRWGIALAGIVLQVVLGSVYAWSVYRTPLTHAYGWSIAEVTLTFTLCIGVLGIAAFLGGLWMARVGPRVVGVAGALLYGAGTMLASLSAHKLSVLYASYGVLGGIGLGLAYIVPVAVLVKWFPDRRGFITGVAVGGFGAGALVTAPMATRLIASSGVMHAFLVLGATYTLFGTASAWFMVMPEPGYAPAGWVPKTSGATHGGLTLSQAVSTWQWWVLWLILFLNTSAGISLISQESPVFQELAHVTVVAAAGMVGIVSIGNAMGRVAWSWVSDGFGRRTTFVVMFVAQAVLFWLLPSAGAPLSVTALAFVILMCYGGGFGTMPAFAADYFGPANVGPIYGLMLTAWGAASAFGPLLIAHMRQANSSYRGGFHLLAVIVLLSLAFPLMLRPPQIPESA